VVVAGAYVCVVPPSGGKATRSSAEPAAILARIERAEAVDEACHKNNNEYKLIFLYYNIKMFFT
jgi:hypothetical protein